MSINVYYVYANYSYRGWVPKGVLELLVLELLAGELHLFLYYKITLCVLWPIIRNHEMWKSEAGQSLV